MAGPYELQSPKDIAMEYGGNKQKIARAAQMGMLDPTAAVLAGMFIDRMRKAQQEEVSDETVAEETFAPPQMAMAPQMGVPSQMPQEGGAGLDSLPVPESTFTAAEGGLVAFENGGGVDYSQFGDIGEELKRQEELRRLYLGENEALKAEREGMDAAKSEQRAMRLIEAGLGIAGGESPYALQNIAKGAMPAVRGYGEDVAAQRKRAVELAGMERAEKGKVLESAMGEVRAREKNTPEAIRAARELQAEAREAGRKVPTLAEAIKSIERTSGTATLQAAYVGSQKDAAKAVNELLSSSIFKADLKSIEKKEGKAAAEEYKRRRVIETASLFPGADINQILGVVGRGSPSSAPSGTVDKNNPLLR